MSILNLEFYTFEKKVYKILDGAEKRNKNFSINQYIEKPSRIYYYLIVPNLAISIFEN